MSPLLWIWAIGAALETCYQVAQSWVNNEEILEFGMGLIAALLWPIGLYCRLRRRLDS